MIALATALGMYGALMTGMWLGAKETLEIVRRDREHWKQMYRNERSHIEEMLKLDE